MNAKKLGFVFFGVLLLGSIWVNEIDGKTYPSATLPNTPQPSTGNNVEMPKKPTTPEIKVTPTIEFQHTTYDLTDTLGLVITDPNLPEMSLDAIKNLDIVFRSGTSKIELAQGVYSIVEINKGTYKITTPVNSIVTDYGYLWADYSYKTIAGIEKISTYVLIQPSYEKAMPPEVLVPNSSWSPQIDTKIFDLTRVESPKEYALKKLIPYDENTRKVRLVVEVSDSNALNEIINQGGSVEAVGIGQTQITFPVENITNLGDIEGLKSVFAPTLIHQHQIISEGVPIIQADKVHSAYTGKNVKVAVLDMAFDVYNQEIKDNIKETKQFRKAFDGKVMNIIGNGYESIHGTAVAEIIVDVAPDVQLYLYTIGTEIEFQNAIDSILARKDIDVLTMSAGWVNQLTDGKSQVTNKLSEAASQIPTIISAGNYRQTHWEGSFNDFSSQVESLSIPIEQNRGYPIWIFLMWDITSEDYNMVLKDSSGKQVDISTNRQYNGYPHGLETISYEPESGGVYTLEISFAGTGTPRSNLELFSTTEQQFNPFTSKGSSAVPTDASNVITVGAVDFQNNLQAYSSEGPTNNRNSVPKIMAPDGVATSAYGEERFFGTSAAAPHVAGIAALLLEKNPELSRQQVVDLILENVDRGGLASATFISDASQTDTSISSSPIEAENTISTVKVPDWIKQQTKWWTNNAISDNEFVQAIQYLIKNDIIVIPNIPESTNKKSDIVPDWVRTNARWWTEDKITDTDFAKGLEFLIKEGIIRIN